MSSSAHALAGNVRLLKSRVSRHAWAGALVAMATVVIATLLTTYLADRELSLEGIWRQQASNPVLWVLDLMPFLFAFWGQYASYVMAYEAGALVVDQTQELRSQTEALESQILRNATHDALTDLPNRVLLHDRLSQVLNATGNDGERQTAVLMLDLDSFKDINDTLGHYNGDRLLKNLATRLRGVIKAGDTVARLGGDEFAILLPRLSEASDVNRVAARIQKALEPPFSLEGLSIQVRASIGAAVFPHHGSDADALIQRADVAMYAAKHERRGFLVYTPAMDRHSPQRLTLMGELRQSLLKEELVLYYQPKVRAADNQVIGVEALVRWNHPNHGLMLPDDFIGLAERTGMMGELTLWVLKRALSQASAWHKLGLELGVAVNVSARALLDVEFPDLIAGLLASCEVPAERLVLEITETTLMTDQMLARKVLGRLSGMGVRISIDDFGTGYSSLSYLKMLPISEIKIDRSFVLDMLGNPNDAVIVRATIELAHNLGMQVVAEGVENAETQAQLRELGCDVLQGFGIGQPLPAEKVGAWLREWKTRQRGLARAANETSEP